MKQLPFLIALFIFAVNALGQRTKAAERLVYLKSSDGTILKATYFAAAKPGPGVLLLH